MQTPPQDDCAKCAALCCMTMAFDQGPMFAYDKPPGVACRELRGNGTCGIHDTLADQGFRGCVQYTCHGVGPRVVQDCFDGATWQDDARLTAPMIHAFATARRLHDLLLLLRSALSLPLSDAQRTAAHDLINRLTPKGKLSTGWLDQTQASGIETQVQDYLAGLRDTALRR